MVAMTPEQKALFDELTRLQKEIAINSLSGMSNIDAYRNSSGKAKTQEAMEAGASEILNNPKVKEFLDSMRQAAVSKAIMSREEMMERLSNLSRANMADLIVFQSGQIDEDTGEMSQTFWRIKDSAEMNRDLMASIAEVTAGKEGIKIKQHSPLMAMKQLADLAGYNAAQKFDHQSTDGSMSPAGKSLDDFYKDDV